MAVAITPAPAAAIKGETALVDDPKAAGEPFLQRWARRKAEADSPAAEESAAAATDIQTESVSGAPLAPRDVSPDVSPDGEEPEIDLASLPDVDSLDESSDFSVFMQNGIPEELQKRALHKLWRLDPSFGHIDGLLDYGEDYTGNGLADEVVNTIYKVGKGMMTDEEEAAEIAAAGDGDAEPDEDAAGDVALAPSAGTPEASLDPIDDTAPGGATTEKPAVTLAVTPADGNHET
jgi:hypothetical protein